jgi:hypothetical protein
MWDDDAKILKVVEREFAKQKVWNFGCRVTAGMVE